MQRIALGEGNHLLDLRANRLGLGDRGLDPIFHNQTRRQRPKERTPS
jgi:hypothetical protein